MRIYRSKTIAATIRQKADIASKFIGKGRPLTAEDFEIVPEHEEPYLAECYCDVCGAEAVWTNSERDNSALITLQLEREWSNELGGGDTCTDEFFDDWEPEVCEACMRTILAPYLRSLRRPTPAPREEPPEENAVLSAPDAFAQRIGQAQGPLIGAEEEGGASVPPLPPLTAEEPF